MGSMFILYLKNWSNVAIYIKKIVYIKPQGVCKDALFSVIAFNTDRTLGIMVLLCDVKLIRHPLFLWLINLNARRVPLISNTFLKIKSI